MNDPNPPAYRPTPPEALRQCPVAGCTALMPAQVPVCGEHWDLAPAPQRTAAWNEYNNGQPTAAYPRVCEALCDAVNIIVAKRAAKVATS